MIGTTKTKLFKQKLDGYCYYPLLYRTLQNTNGFFVGGFHVTGVESHFSWQNLWRVL
jgi:hypothetical protein